MKLLVDGDIGGMKMWMHGVECPYCGKENDVSEALHDIDGFSTIDWECEHCEIEFELEAEFTVSFSAAKIEYVTCDECKKEVRDVYRVGDSFPLLKDYPEDARLCSSCRSKARRCN